MDPDDYKGTAEAAVGEPEDHWWSLETNPACVTDRDGEITVDRYLRGSKASVPEAAWRGGAGQVPAKLKCRLYLGRSTYMWAAFVAQAPIS